jgi:hypothetical protein
MQVDPLMFCIRNSVVAHFVALLGLTKDMNKTST